MQEDEVTESKVEEVSSDSKDSENSTAEIDRESLRQFLTFAVGNEEYGVDLLRIREIKGWTETTRLPNSPEFMKGVINLRGAVIPIFDLKGRFSMGETEATVKHVVIIMAIGDRLLGMLVDSVSDIIEVNESEIRNAPQMEDKINDEFVKGLISINEKMVVILDIDNLFDSEDLNGVEKASLESVSGE